jgi:flagellar motor component MotA
MTILLILLIISCTLMEINQKIDTSNVFEKIAMGSIVIGSILKLAGHESVLIIFGASLYFVVMAYQGFKTRKNRRASDETHLNT